LRLPAGSPAGNRLLLADDAKIIIRADYTPGRMADACDMHQVFAEIDRLRIAEAERAAERYRREMRPRSRARIAVSFRRRRQTVRLRPATESF